MSEKKCSNCEWFKRVRDPKLNTKYNRCTHSRIFIQRIDPCPYWRPRENVK